MFFWFPDSHGLLKPVLPFKLYAISKVLFSSQKNRDFTLLYVLRIYEKILDVLPAVQLSSPQMP